MHYAIPLALAGSLCTATSSVCQRLGAKNSEATRVDLWLIVRLARRPIWLVGLASQILGFAFQVAALHYGALALVQPVFALELLLVFGSMTVLGAGRVKRRDWLAAADDGRPRPAPARRLAVGRAPACPGVVVVASGPD